MKCAPRARIVGERESIDHAATRQMLLFLDFHRSFKRWIRVFSNRRRSLSVSREYFRALECRVCKLRLLFTIFPTREKLGRRTIDELQ